MYTLQPSGSDSIVAIYADGIAILAVHSDPSVVFVSNWIVFIYVHKN